MRVVVYYISLVVLCSLQASQRQASKPKKPDELKQKKNKDYIPHPQSAFNSYRCEQKSDNSRHTPIKECCNIQ